MYQLNFEDCILYAPLIPTLDIWDVNVHLVVDEAGSMSFTLPGAHPYLARLTVLKGRLELLSDGVPIFRGRILSDTLNFDGTHTVEAEGQLACLNDSLVAPFSFPGSYEGTAEYESAENVVAFWLGKLLDSHNAQVSEEQQIKLGSVTVTDPNNYIARSCEDWQTTWACITSRLTGSALGGHLLVRYEADGTYLDYLADYPLSNTQSVHYGGNLLELTDEIDAAELYTAILPVGADGLTIAALPDGDLTEDLVKAGQLIYSRAAVEKYGRVVSAQHWDDVTVADNLQQKAMALLAQSGVLATRTISVTAVDLHDTDADIAALRVGRYTDVISEPHGLNARYVIAELEPDILDPGNTRITLGAAVQTGTDRSQSALARVDAAQDKLQMEVNTQQESLNQLAETTSRQITEVVQTSREILLSALTEYTRTSDFEQYQETVSSQLAILTDQIELKLRRVAEEITSVNGDVQAQKSELSKYFRFTTEGLVIGETGNQITLKVDNDRISFLDAGLEVAYITDRRLTITDAHFLSSLRIGNFAWLPRRNGNLSLVRVEGEEV